MFWRSRKRKEAAALKAAQKDDTLPQEDTPEPVTSSNDEDDSVEPAAVNEEEEVESEEEMEEKAEGEWQPPPKPAPPVSLLERKRQEAMKEQKRQETIALAQNSFCKNQRVQYLHRATGRRFEAVIVAVHFDDGVDHPYFTVRYETSGNQPETIEKQTTSDRLSYIAFDEAKTYQIISSKIKL